MRTIRSIAVVLLTATASVAIMPTPSFAQIGLSIQVNIAPPALPVYVQPPIPAPGYLWTPGYWGWNGADYYWVPGTWVLPPAVGVLWTPGYWGFANGVYGFNAGYWGPHVGFYGGVSYGFGYTGVGFAGGYWNNGAFNYNSSVTNIGGAHITNVYNKTVVENHTTNNVSYNGGPGGTTAKPTPEELAAAKEPHTPPTGAQESHQKAASTNKALFSKNNHGKPPIAATERPGEFKGAGHEKEAASPKGGETKDLKPAPDKTSPKIEHKAQAPHAVEHEAQAPHAAHMQPMVRPRPGAPRPHPAGPARRAPPPRRH
jgi:hypothetical protein